MGSDILLVAEHQGGRLAPPIPELVAKGRALAAQTGGVLSACVAGHESGAVADSLASYGVQTLLADDPALREYTFDGYAQAVRAALAARSPSVVLIAHTAQGTDLAPALAASLDVGVVTNCVEVRMEDGALVATRRMLNEKVQGEFEVRSDGPIVVTMRPGAVKPADPAPGGTVSRLEAPIDPAGIRARFLRMEAPEVQDIDIGQADIVVSAGRGIQKKENLELVERLAKRLGGVVGASRPLTDMDWLPKTRQVGQSGKSVRPKLYIACGISGAMQHVAGMKDAGLILAINTDPSAPIFEVAHVGFVANVLELIPAVLKELGG